MEGLKKWLTTSSEGENQGTCQLDYERKDRDKPTAEVQGTVKVEGSASCIFTCLKGDRFNYFNMTAATKNMTVMDGYPHSFRCN